MRQIALVSAAAVGAALLFGACGKSQNPVSPSSSGASGPRVNVSASPLPVPMEARDTAQRSRYQISSEVVFRETAGRSGRLTEMTLTIVGGQGQGSSERIPLDLALPAGGTVRQRFSAQVDTSALQAPFQLRIAATGLDQDDQAFEVEAVHLPVSLDGAGANGSPINHVFVVVEENEGFEEALGGPSMPYLNSLAAQYAMATEYYANTHPSIGNYLMLTVGETITNSSNYSGPVTEDNIVRQLVGAGKTWKSYAEDLPSVGYTGGDTGLYARRHNPLAFLSDVVNNASQAMNLVPFTQFGTDLATNAFPNYSFIVPNLCHDGHDCPLSLADAWLQSNIGPLIGSAQFQRDGLLIILFDEAADADRRHGGGHVAWVAVGAKAKRGYRSTTLYQHESTLRLTAEALGLSAFPNRAAGARDMNEFFTP
jgi:phosphatidylinositol-3-phosphatase